MGDAGAWAVRRVPVRLNRGFRGLADLKREIEGDSPASLEENVRS